MPQIAQQWPLLAGFLVLAGALLRIVQQQYERIIRDLEEDRDLWRDLALSGTSMADKLAGVVEHSAKRQR